MRAVAFALVILCAPVGASAANLDAPMKPRPPTLRSEIKRGADAELDCSLHLPDVLDGEALLDCLDHVQSANRQSMGRGYEAFDAGLWYMGLADFRNLESVAPSDLVASESKVAEAGLRESEQAISATDAEVDRAIRSR